MFWITSGLLIYTAGTFFIFLFGEYIYNPKEVSDDVFDFFWNTSQLLFMIFCLFFSVGLWFGRYDHENVV
jgi:ABC-type dipeptide/oligopeptide/nickel transport system permease component